MADFDLAVIGSGAGGAAIARDAAGRGVKVLLLDESDLASDASSGPHMLVQSALQSRCRSLGTWRAVLAEREVMLATAPHLARAQRLVLLPQDSARTPLGLRGRLFIYDHLASRRILPATQALDLTHHPFGTALRRTFAFGFACSDCRVDDVRLPVANAREAADRGAVVRTRTRCVRAERSEEWTLVVNARGERLSIAARVLVNAAGPGLEKIAAKLCGGASPIAIRNVKETYIVAARAFDHDGGYLLPDRRGGFVLALPLGADSMLIGPLEKAYSGAGAPAAPTAEEVASLCALANHYFRHAIPLDDVSPFSCTRAIPKRAESAPTSTVPDHVIHLDKPRGLAPLLTVCGGHALLARRLAETAVDRIARFFAAPPSWTRGAPLPGGDFAVDGLDALVAATERRWPFLDAPHARRLVSSYGTRVERILGTAAQAGDLGEQFGADLTAAEIAYLMDEEWAETAEDVLWRRSSLGLRLSATERATLDRFMTTRSRAGAKKEFH